MLDKRLSAINKRDKFGYVRPLGYPPRETSEISAGFRGAEISLSHERLFDEMEGVTATNIPWFGKWKGEREGGVKGGRACSSFVLN